MKELGNFRVCSFVSTLGFTFQSKTNRYLKYASALTQPNFSVIHPFGQASSRFYNYVCNFVTITLFYSDFYDYLWVTLNLDVIFVVADIAAIACTTSQTVMRNSDILRWYFFPKPFRLTSAPPIFSALYARYSHNKGGR